MKYSPAGSRVCSFAFFIALRRFFTASSPRSFIEAVAALMLIPFALAMTADGNAETAEPNLSDASRMASRTVLPSLIDVLILSVTVWYIIIEPIWRYANGIPMNGVIMFGVKFSMVLPSLVSIVFFAVFSDSSAAVPYWL